MTVFTEEVEKFLEADPPSRYAATARHVLSVSTFNVSLSTFHVSSDGKWNYVWNGENRLVAMSNAATVLSFAYDSQGRRFLKIVDDGSSVTTNTFLYDDWNMIQETITGGTSSVNHYTWGIDLSGTLQGAGGVGGLLAVSTFNVSLSTFHVSSDANGNITEYVSTNGTVVAHYQYGPFGETIAATGEMKDNFKYRFSSKYEDTETGLLYYGYRFYNSEMGRWLNRDPIEEKGGLNVYGFVGNDPVLGFDVYGLFLYPGGRWPDIPGGWRRRFPRFPRFPRHRRRRPEPPVWELDPLPIPPEDFDPSLWPIEKSYGPNEEDCGTDEVLRLLYLKTIERRIYVGSFPDGVGVPPPHTGKDPSVRHVFEWRLYMVVWRNVCVCKDATPEYSVIGPHTAGIIREKVEIWKWDETACCKD